MDEIAFGIVAALLACCEVWFDTGALPILFAICVAALILLLLCVVAFLDPVVIRSPTITASVACLG